MHAKERRFRRDRVWYRIWLSVMSVAGIALVIGILSVFINHVLGISLMTYGVLISVFGAAFFLIARTRYYKSKLAFDAYQRAMHTHVKDVQ